jgi:hypothetical protein
MLRKLPIDVPVDFRARLIGMEYGARRGGRGLLRGGLLGRRRERRDEEKKNDYGAQLQAHEGSPESFTV